MEATPRLVLYSTTMAGPSPLMTLAELEQTLSRTFELAGLGGEDWNDDTIVPSLESPNTDVHALIAALPRLHTRPGGGFGADLDLEQTLGEGGMGVVRLAKQSSLGREVAVKSVRSDKGSPEAVLQLLREAWVTGRLEHPNIVPIYTLGVDGDGRPMIVMKRIEGTPWSDYLRGRAEPPEVTTPAKKLAWNLRVLMQVANAIELAGSKGIVHRDLKPDNVMIGRFGEVYVLDWGIAVSLGDAGAGRLPLAAKAHGFAGTPGYMAPEMVEEGAANLSTKTDVYLLGSVLHEVLTGKPRHTGRSVLECLFSAYRSTPFEYSPEIPAELAAIANRATSRAPEGRFEDAAAFRRALEMFQEHENSRALASEAKRRLVELERLAEEERAAPVAEVSTERATVHEDTIYKIFGECRFGFMQALRAWPENPEGRPGLDRALAVMIDHEVRRENVTAASALLLEVATPPPALVERVEALRARLAAKAEKLARLEADRNLETGLRTRSFLALVLAFFWASLPLGVGLARDLWGHAPAYRDYLAGFVVLTLGTIGGTWWARDSLTRTAVNRQITASVYFSGLGILMSKLAGIALQLPLEQTAFFDMIVLSVVTLAIASATDRRLIAAGVFPAITFTAAALRPELAFYALAAAKFTSFLTAAFIWRPRTWAALTAPRPGSRRALEAEARARRP